MREFFLNRFIWCLDSPGWGGSEINVVRVWQMLRRRHDGACLSDRAAFELRRQCEIHQFRCVRMPSGNSLRSAPRVLPAAMAFAARYRAREFVVWAHHCDSNRWLQLALALLRRRFYIVEQLVPPSRDSFQKSRLTIPLKRFVAQRARNIIVNGYSQAAHYAQLFGIRNDQVTVVANSRRVREIRHRVLELRRDKEALRSMLGLRDGPHVICVGRLDPQKDQSTLIRAVARVKLSWPRIHVLFLGDGPDRTQLERLSAELIPETALFKGHCDDPCPWLAASDLFVLPSLAEGLPGALIEAMAAELPCLVTDIPGNRELVEQNVTGLLFPPLNDQILAACLQSALSDVQATAALAMRAAELVAREYDESREAVSWNRLFSERVKPTPVGS